MIETQSWVSTLGFLFRFKEAIEPRVATDSNGGIQFVVHIEKAINLVDTERAKCANHGEAEFGLDIAFAFGLDFKPATVFTFNLIIDDGCICRLGEVGPVSQPTNPIKFCITIALAGYVQELLPAMTYWHPNLHCPLRRSASQYPSVQNDGGTMSACA